MTTTRTVLVVDDDRDMVSTLCDILEYHGWTTLRGYSGSEAVRLAARPDVHAVVMDIRMPGLSGVEALRAIRRERPDMPAVLMTAQASPETLDEAQRYGVRAVLRKPLQLPQLLELLAT